MNVKTIHTAAGIIGGTAVIAAGTVGALKLMRPDESGEPRHISAGQGAAAMGGVLALGLGGTWGAIKASDALMKVAGGSGHPALRATAAAAAGLGVGLMFPFTLASVPVIGLGPVALVAAALEDKDRAQRPAS